MNTSTHIQTNTLPSNVFELKHDEFYEFIGLECGIVQAKILQFQLISDVDTFVECEHPTEILKYNCKQLNELREDSCLITDSETFIVLPGIAASFSSLKKRLLKKMDENFKEQKRNKNSSNILTSTPLTTSTISQSKTLDEIRSHIAKSLDQWIDKYRKDLGLQPDTSLSESIDYTVEFKKNSIDRPSVLILCSCGSKASLTRHPNNGYYQVSR